MEGNSQKGGKMEKKKSRKWNRKMFLVLALFVIALVIGIFVFRQFVQIPNEKVQRAKSMRERQALQNLDTERNIYEAVKKAERIFRNWERVSAEELTQMYSIIISEFHCSLDEAADMLSGSKQEICYRLTAKRFHKSVDEVRVIVSKMEVNGK